MQRHWAEKYVGTPYSLYDCAELCTLVQKEQFDKKLNLPLDRPKGVRSISKKINYLQDDYAIKIDAPEEGDAILMIGRGRINHIGTACYINGVLYVLHAMRNVGMAALHRVSSLGSIGLKVEGYYKWQ